VKVVLWLLKWTGIVTGGVIGGVVILLCALWAFVSCANWAANGMGKVADEIVEQRQADTAACEAKAHRFEVMVDPHHKTFTGVRCWGYGKDVNVYIRDGQWIMATHYQRVHMRDLLEQAFPGDAVHLVSAQTGEPLDVRGGVR
jgi:hypothetical protein